MKTCALYLCLAGVAAFVRAADPAQVAPPKAAAGEIGSRLPQFSAKDMHGHAISTADLHGKVVLIDIWATWCEPCKREMPGYQKLLDRYSATGFAVVGLKTNMMKDTEDPLEFARRIGVRYPLVVAGEDLLAKFGGLQGLPTTLIYDRQGILRKKVIGFEYTHIIEASLKQLLLQ